MAAHEAAARTTLEPQRWRVLIEEAHRAIVRVVPWLVLNPQSLETRQYRLAHQILEARKEASVVQHSARQQLLLVHRLPCVRIEVKVFQPLRLCGRR
jgi:hypothetical protein